MRDGLSAGDAGLSRTRILSLREEVTTLPTTRNAFLAVLMAIMDDSARSDAYTMIKFYSRS